MKHFWIGITLVSVIGVMGVVAYYGHNGVYPEEDITMIGLFLLFIFLFMTSLLIGNKSHYKCIMCEQPCTYEELYDNTAAGYGEVCNNCVARRKRTKL
jgi:hypothetical protein